MSVYVGLFVLLVTPTRAVASDVPPFASTPEYKSMLNDLARKAPRPSRIASAGELVTSKQPDVAVEEKESGEGLRLETQVWTLEIADNPFGMTFTNKLTGAGWKLAGVNYEGSGSTSAPPAQQSTAHRIIRLERVGKTERHPGQWVFAGTLEGSPEPVRIEISLAGPNAVGISIDASGLGVETSSEFHMTGPGPFFGLGEQYNRANLDYFKTNLHPDDKPGTPGHLWDYMSVPFVYSPKGIGVYFDSAFNCLFDSTGAGQPGFTMRFGGEPVDFYMLAAPDPKGVLRTYTGLTGRTPLPPPWAFGVWHNSLEGSEAVLKDAQDLRNARIPVSALWVSDLMDQSDNIGWPLWTAGYHGPPGPFTEELHKLGFKVLAYFYPYVRSLLLPHPLENPTFAEAVRNHFLVTDPQGKPVGPTFEPVLTGNVDSTNPEAVNWWQEKIQRALSQYNFDGWMEDFGEWTHDDSRFAAGKTGREMATLNPLFWHKIAYEIAHRAKPDVVEFARSGAPGSQAFTRVLWGATRWQIGLPITGWPPW